MEEENVTTILCKGTELSKDTTTVKTICFCLVVGNFGVLVNLKPFFGAKIYYVIVAEV